MPYIYIENCSVYNWITFGLRTLVSPFHEYFIHRAISNYLMGKRQSAATLLFTKSGYSLMKTHSSVLLLLYTFARSSMALIGGWLVFWNVWKRCIVHTQALFNWDNKLKRKTERHKRPVKHLGGAIEVRLEK